jgi:hypothetical protein
MSVDFQVHKRCDERTFDCRACEISPSGIRLARQPASETPDTPVNLEIPLVEGHLTTEIPVRPVWSDSRFEAFEFQGTSFAQQAMLERLFGNY